MTVQYELSYAREDEHMLILQYCQMLGGESPLSQPQSPAQILQAVEKEERGELERVIARLEEEQRNLQIEYEYLKEQHCLKGTSSLTSPPHSVASGQPGGPAEAELLAEAKLLRQHKGRLEARMQILEDHNKQLESQLHRLRQLLEQWEADSEHLEKLWAAVSHQGTVRADLLRERVAPPAPPVPLEPQGPTSADWQEDMLSISASDEVGEQELAFPSEDVESDSDSPAVKLSLLEELLLLIKRATEVLQVPWPIEGETRQSVFDDEPTTSPLILQLLQE
ncbi:UNVERIFIED_CONTAM: hypothetical protein FKN15_035890 [Acipenser sinensis]